MTQDQKNIDGMLAYGIGRFSFLGDASGGALEIALGGGTGHGETRASAAVGYFLSFLFVDVGYSFQFPLDMGTRPSWLSGHQFSARINIPLYSYGVRSYETQDK